MPVMTVTQSAGFAPRPDPPFVATSPHEFAAANRANYAGISDRSRPLAVARLVHGSLPPTEACDEILPGHLLVCPYRNLRCHTCSGSGSGLLASKNRRAARVGASENRSAK